MSVLETWTEPRPIKLTATDFLQLSEAGAFRGYGKTELIDGMILCMNAQHSTHGLVQAETIVRLVLALRDAAPSLRVSTETTLAVSRADMPQPDLVVTSYRGPRAPLPVASVPLVVEIADTTAAYDRGSKARLYAAGGVPEYWVVDLEAGEVARFWEPGADGYGRQDSTPLGDQVAAKTIPALSISTEDLLPS